MPINTVESSVEVRSAAAARLGCEWSWQADDEDPNPPCAHSLIEIFPLAEVLVANPSTGRVSLVVQGQDAEERVFTMNQTAAFAPKRAR